MAEENIIFNTTIKTGDSAQSIKSIRTELRQLTQELAGLEPGSQAFIQAATRAGELRDRMDDANNAVKAFNPEAKFQAIANVVGIAANGFSALQGAMSLFGDESKDLQQVIARTQGAIALATGLNGLLGMGDAFKLLGTQVANLIPLLRGMSAAMLGALTGGITIAITLVISYWKELKELITGTVEEVKLSNEQIKQSTEKGSAAFKKAADERHDLEIRRLKTLKQTQEVEKQIAAEERQKAIDSAIAEKKSKDYFLVIEAEYRNSLLAIDKKYNDIEAEQAKAKADKLKEISDWEDKQIEEGNKAIREERQKAFEEDNKQRAEELDLRAANEKYFADFIKEIDDQALNDKKENAKAEIELEKQKEQNRIDALQSTSTALRGFAELAGQQTALGKGLAVATTTIDTYVAAQAAYKSAADIPYVGAILAPIAAAGAIAAGLARVRAIMAVKVPGNSGGGNAMPSMGGSNTPPITRPSSSIVRLGNSEPIKTVQDGKQKVYVLESDITDTQAKVNSIRQKATIQ